MDAPQLGIFWFVSDPPRQVHILAVVCPLSAADEYGDCLTCLAGHYLTWQAWRRGRPKPPPWLASVIAHGEYELWPRGRIIYEQPTDRFVIYVDRQLLAAPRLFQIRTHCHLPPQRTIAPADLYYRSARTIGPPDLARHPQAGKAIKSPNRPLAPPTTH
jgi:hypothetical protein